MGRRLGSGYELGVGRALRSSSVLFIEGDDAPVLAHLARRLGSSAVASSDNYATVPLGGLTRISLVSAFAETMTALGSAVETFVILDSDLRCQEAIDIETHELRQAGARFMSGVDASCRTTCWWLLRSQRSLEFRVRVLRILLNEVISEQKDETFNLLKVKRLDEHRHKIGATATLTEKTVVNYARTEFSIRWTTREGQLGLVDAKATIRMLNAQLQSRRLKTINIHSLARNIPPHDIPYEVQGVIHDLVS